MKKHQEENTTKSQDMQMLKIYSLPKIHKPNVALKPIISAIE